MSALAIDTANAETPKSSSGVVFGRFMLPDMTEHACQVLDMSHQGATFITADIAPRGLPIVAYLEDLGRVEVISSDPVEGGFRVNFSATGSRLERLTQRIDWVLQRGSTASGIDQRRHPRFEPKDKHSVITLPDGRTYACEVMDISVSGAAIKTDVMPSMGTFIMVGRMKGRVVRYLENGVAIEFVKHLDSSSLSVA